MVTWNSVNPDTAKSVKENGPKMQENTTYTEEIMGNTANDTTNTDVIRDHYWDVSANLDGRHRYLNMPAFTIAGTETDPVLGDGMGGTAYCRTKTAAESPDVQDVQPFFRNTADIMQLLGLRACCTFQGRTTNGVCTIEYAHNITSVTRTATGKYDVIFANGLPSENYLMHGGGARKSNVSRQIVLLTIQGANAVLGDVKTTAGMAITTLASDITFGESASETDVFQGWFFCFGG